MKKISLSAPAKINWNLHIGEIQKNGLHEIYTEMEKISLADELEIEILPQEKQGEIDFVLKNPQEFSVPKDETNLAVRAARSFFGETLFPAICIRLTKNIPTGSGLGGGSSDAAAVLKGLSQMFPECISESELFHIASNLGSDIPFFFGNFSRATIEGTGERLTPLPQISSGFLTLCLPKNISISTAWAYEEWEKRKTTVPNGNDFEPIIFSAFPELSHRATLLKEFGAEHTALSGSGGTVFGVFSEKAKAEKTQKMLKEHGDWTAVCRLK
ncbi:4-(cytidine 5'-diphospho)-2-C-methyl-D-erythritol kinase [Candidatus Peregrinibacteria bacterium]|nr:MAG: 4-(cytidine 5'-diphospho)-2-C-methyl-D-erythritol kinase [Candidatus Peregrinibacteria bacterium]